MNNGAALLPLLSSTAVAADASDGVHVNAQ